MGFVLFIIIVIAVLLVFAILSVVFLICCCIMHKEIDEYNENIEKVKRNDPFTDEEKERYLEDYENFRENKL